MERFTAADAILLHFERNSPMHTLKVAVVDSTRRGAPLTVDDVSSAIEHHLDRYPRARERVVFARGFPGRPFWVDAWNIKVPRHVDERTAVAPGDRAAFDRVLGDLAERRLSMERPLWRVTLIHGLEGGRQALAVQVHHAITDGSAAAAAFEGLTTAEPDGEPEMPCVPHRPHPGRSLAAVAAGEVPRAAAAAARAVRAAARGTRAAREFRAGAEHLPDAGLPGYRDTFLLSPFGDERRCATASLPLADFRSVGKATGATVNGVLHAALAGALRTERLRRGEDPTRPVAAAFGIALDDPDAPRRYWGNNVTPTYVSLFTGEADPLERLRRTAGSAREGVELRRTSGPDATAQIGEVAPRLPGAFIRRAKDLIPSGAHIVTANVRGPAQHRWLGDCEVTDWYSFAVLVPPIPLNITVYSYAGEMKFGFLTAPEVFEDPRRLLDGVADSLAELVKLTR